MVLQPPPRPAADDFQPVRAVNAIGVQPALAEHPAEAVGQGDVGVQVRDPAAVPQVGQAEIDQQTLVEGRAVVAVVVGLHARHAVPRTDGLRQGVVVGSDHDEVVEVVEVFQERRLQEIAVADRDGDALEVEAGGGEGVGWYMGKTPKLGKRSWQSFRL